MVGIITVVFVNARKLYLNPQQNNHDINGKKPKQHIIQLVNVKKHHRNALCQLLSPCTIAILIVLDIKRALERCKKYMKIMRNAKENA